MDQTVIQVGMWRLETGSGRMSKGTDTFLLDDRGLDLLMRLAQSAGEVVSIDELLDSTWPGVSVSQDSVYQAIASLRRQLGDDPKQPTYIVTAPRRGYKLIAPVIYEESQPVPLGEVPLPGTEKGAAAAVDQKPEKPSSHRQQPGWRLVLLGALATVVIAVGLHYRFAAFGGVSPPSRSVAVLPFLDLTEGMKNEEFADGMTEEMIDKLSKVPGLTVPSPTASFALKNKQQSPTAAADSLGVRYILDGSVRKSEHGIRIAARLMRAEDGYVIWTETYDRPVNDLLWVQDDIASQATVALEKSGRL